MDKINIIFDKLIENKITLEDARKQVLDLFGDLDSYIDVDTDIDLVFKPKHRISKNAKQTWK